MFSWQGIQYTQHMDTDRYIEVNVFFSNVMIQLSQSSDLYDEDPQKVRVLKKEKDF